MSGNVYEWVSDWYGDYSADGRQQNPVGPPTGAERVFRGGGWYRDARYSRAANRGFSAPGYHDAYLGLRLAAPAAP